MTLLQLLQLSNKMGCEEAEAACLSMAERGPQKTECEKGKAAKYLNVYWKELSQRTWFHLHDLWVTPKSNTNQRKVSFYISLI